MANQEAERVTGNGQGSTSRELLPLPRSHYSVSIDSQKAPAISGLSVGPRSLHRAFLTEPVKKKNCYKVLYRSRKPHRACSSQDQAPGSAISILPFD